MRNRIAKVLGIASLVIALMMLTCCGDDDSATGEETAATAEIQTLLEDYHAAFNAYDPEGFLDLVTAGYIQDREGVLVDATETADEIGQLEEFDWDGIQGVSTFTVVDDGGTLKVSRHDYVGNN